MLFKYNAFRQQQMSIPEDIGRDLIVNGLDSLNVQFIIMHAITFAS